MCVGVCSLVPRLSLLHVHTNFMHMTFHLVSGGGAWYIWAREQRDRWTLFDARAMGWTSFDAVASGCDTWPLQCSRSKGVSLPRSLQSYLSTPACRGAAVNPGEDASHPSTIFCQSGRLPSPRLVTLSCFRLVCCHELYIAVVYLYNNV